MKTRTSFWKTCLPYGRHFPIIFQLRKKSIVYLNFGVFKVTLSVQTLGHWTSTHRDSPHVATVQPPAVILYFQNGPKTYLVFPSSMLLGTSIALKTKFPVNRSHVECQMNRNCINTILKRRVVSNSYLIKGKSPFDGDAPGTKWIALSKVTSRSFCFT